MAIKAGQILHAMNRSVVDRIQTAGAGNLNIPTEKIRELGNYQTVATVRDIPDLSFNLDCLDVDTEVEALLTGVSSADVDAEAFGTSTPDTPGVDASEYDLLQNYAVNINSPWKSRQGDFDVVKSVAIPALTLEQAAYRYGLRENAGETFTLRGDSIFYVPGSVWTYETEGDDIVSAFDFVVQFPPPPPGKMTDEATPQPIPADDVPVHALLYQEGGENRFALEVSINYERLVKGDDYIEDFGWYETDGITEPGELLVVADEYVLDADQENPAASSVRLGTGIQLTQRYLDRAFNGGVPSSTDKIAIVFGFSPDDPQFRLFAPNGDIWPQTIHQGLSVKPAAVRGKDIDLYVALTDLGQAPVWADPGNPVDHEFRRWNDVQAFNVDWRVTIEDDFEFGNPRAVNRDYSDNPEVTGSVEVRHRDLDTMFEKLRAITGVPDGQIIGPQSSKAVHLMLVLRNPEGHGTTNPNLPDGPAGNGDKTGAVLKTLYVPDARFILPGYEGRVQQKLNQTMNFDSDGGILKIFKGAPSDSQFITV